MNARMSDPVYAAHVQAVIDKAPPLSQQQRDELGPLLRDTVPPRASTTRKTA